MPLWGRMSATTYQKLTLGEWLPVEIERALWLDCDMLVLAAIALLATCSFVCLLLALRAFRAGGEKVPAVLCALEVLVILLAASGLLAAGH